MGLAALYAVYVYCCLLSNTKRFIRCCAMRAPVVSAYIVVMMMLLLCLAEQPIANNSLVHIAVIVDAKTPGLIGATAGRQQVAEELLRPYNITVQSYLLTVAEVVNSSVLQNLQVRHVTVSSTRFSRSIPTEMVDVMFTYTFRSTLVPIELGNVEVAAVDGAAMGYMAGLLAGLVSDRKRISVWYAPFYASIPLGVVAGVHRVCPNCIVQSFGLCAGGARCPGEFAQMVASADDADVLIGADAPTNLLPLAILDSNRRSLLNTSTGTAFSTTKRLLVAGNNLGDLSTAVSWNDAFLGAATHQIRDAVRGIAEAALGTFRGGVRSIEYYVTMNASHISHFESVGREFVVERLFMQWGAVVPDYDAISIAQANAGTVGGAPFVPIGLAPNNAAPDEPLTRYFPQEFAATCNGDGGRVFVLSTDLRTVTSFSARTGQFNRIPLDLFTDADYLSAISMPAVASKFNVSRRVVFSGVVPRRRMYCSFIKDAFVLTGGELLTPSLASSAGLEVLRLIPLCVLSATDCDAMVLENATSVYSPVAASPRLMSIGQLILGSSLSVFLPDYSSSSSDARVLSVFDMQMYPISVSFPPTGAATIALEGPAVLSHIQWVSAINAFIGFDPLLRRIVSLELTNAEMSSPQPSVLRWVGATTAFQEGTSSLPLCLFYNRGAGRFGIVATGGEGDAPLVYHYSSDLQSWVLQASLAMSSSPQEVYICLPLNDLDGGGALLVPRTVPVDRLLTIVWYPSSPSVCVADHGEALSISQLTCERCKAGEAGTGDGFCGPLHATAEGGTFPTWAIVVMTLICFVSLLCAIALKVRTFISSRDPFRAARDEHYAPPSGICSVLYVALGDLDVMWTATDDSLLGVSGMSASHLMHELSEVPPSAHPEVLFAQHLRVHRIFDHFATVVRDAVAHHNGYLSAFRGDHAFVVSASSETLLKIVSDITVACALYVDDSAPLAIRIVSGIDKGFLVQSNRGENVLVAQKATQGKREKRTKEQVRDESKAILYSGHALHVARRLSLVSTKGRIVISTDAFEDVDHEVLMKAIQLSVHGDRNIPVQVYEQHVVHVIELESSVASSALDVAGRASMFDETRARRKRILKARRKLELQRRQPSLLRGAQSSDPEHSAPLIGDGALCNPLQPRSAEPSCGAASGTRCTMLAHAATDDATSGPLGDRSKRALPLQLSSAQADAINAFSCTVVRTILTNLSASSRETAAAPTAARKVLFSRLHVDGGLSKRYVEGKDPLPPPSAVRAFAQRVVDVAGGPAGCLRNIGVQHSSFHAAPFDVSQS